jgi:hypothetical protein
MAELTLQLQHAEDYRNSSEIAAKQNCVTIFSKYLNVS